MLETSENLYHFLYFSYWLDLTSGEGDGTPLQYSCLENPIDIGAWWAAVHGVARSRTRLSNFTFTFHFHALEKEMATHSSIIAWRIPRMGEPVGLLSMGSHSVGHDSSDLAAAAAAAVWKIERWLGLIVRDLIWQVISVKTFLIARVTTVTRISLGRVETLALVLSGNRN